MIVLYILILIYFNFNSTSIVNVFMLSIEKTKQKKKTGFFCMADNKNYTPRFQWSPHDENLLT